MASKEKDQENAAHFDQVEFQGEVFVISVAAELAGMHAQTLRT